jgi:hypothetical protein
LFDTGLADNPQINTARVAQMIDELTEADMVWPYEVAATKCAYIPSFQVWSSSRVRQNAPELVPIPPGITYKPFETEKRYGSGIYSYPATKKDLQPTVNTQIGGGQ